MPPAGVASALPVLAPGRYRGVASGAAAVSSARGLAPGPSGGFAASLACPPGATLQQSPSFSPPPPPLRLEGAAQSWREREGEPQLPYPPRCLGEEGGQGSAPSPSPPAPPGIPSSSSSSAHGLRFSEPPLAGCAAAACHCRSALRMHQGAWKPPRAPSRSSAPPETQPFCEGEGCAARLPPRSAPRRATPAAGMPSRGGGGRGRRGGAGGGRGHCGWRRRLLLFPPVLSPPPPPSPSLADGPACVDVKLSSGRSVAVQMCAGVAWLRGVLLGLGGTPVLRASAV